MPEAILLRLAEGQAPLSGWLDGGTFQVHVIGPNLIRLYHVAVCTDTDSRCPIVVHGERCGFAAGHAGPHKWGGGD